jgi:hypothetical protein
MPPIEGGVSVFLSKGHLRINAAILGVPVSNTGNPVDEILFSLYTKKLKFFLWKQKECITISGCAFTWHWGLALLFLPAVAGRFAAIAVI